MSLRTKLIRLAHANPELRPHLLPILRTASEEEGPEIGDFLKSIADVFEAAADESMSESDAKDMIDAFWKVIDSLPKEVQEAARDAFEDSKGKSDKKATMRKVANPLLVAVVVAARTAAHEQQRYDSKRRKSPSYTPSKPTLEEDLWWLFKDAAKSMVKAVGDAAKKVGGALHKAFGKLVKGTHQFELEEEPPKSHGKSDGKNTYDDYVIRKRDEGGKPMSKSDWEARYGK